MNRLALIIVVLLLIALGAFIVSKIEILEELESLGYVGEAARNDYLAAERLIKKLGIPTTSPNTITDLPSTNDAILLIAPRTRFGETRESALWNWVLEGGHLLVTPRQSSALGHDSIFDWADVSPRGNSDIIADSEGVSEGNSDDSVFETLVLESLKGKVYEVKIPLDSEPYRVSFLTSRTLIDRNRDADWKDNSTKSRILRMGIGEGTITFLSEAHWLKNDSLGGEDHARLLWDLLTKEDVPHQVWLVRNDDTPGLPSLLWKHAWAGIIGILVLLILWLWRVGFRFGPMAPEVPTARRGLVTHLDASGQFLWRSGHGRQGLAGLRNSLVIHIRTRHPDCMKLEGEALYLRISEKVNMPVERVQRAFEGDAGKDADTYTAIVKDIQRLGARI